MSLLTFLCVVGITVLSLQSCGNHSLSNFQLRPIKGFSYDPNTATLTITKGQFKLGDLKPDTTANDLYASAQSLEKQGKHSKAYKELKQITKNYPNSTKAPNAFFRIAQYDEASGKWIRAFDYYQKLISTYTGTSLYAQALESQKNIAHASATGQYKEKMLVFKKRVSATSVDKMLTQLIANAPHASSAAHSQYLRGKIWEREKIYDRAMDIYRSIPRDYPNSGYAGEALFRVGSILRMQTTKKSNRNIDNSRNATEAFNELISLYPKHPKAKQAKQINAQIAGYDINRSYEIARFYEEKEQYKSARFYYNDIIKRTDKTSKIHQRAKAKLAALPQ